MSRTNVPIVFECHICGKTWECPRTDYKIFTIKTKSNKYWKRFIAFCPVCQREVSMTYQIENK